MNLVEGLALASGYFGVLLVTLPGARHPWSSAFGITCLAATGVLVGIAIGLRWGRGAK